MVFETKSLAFQNVFRNSNEAHLERSRCRLCTMHASSGEAVWSQMHDLVAAETPNVSRGRSIQCSMSKEQGAQFVFDTRSYHKASGVLWAPLRKTSMAASLGPCPSTMHAEHFSVFKTRCNGRITIFSCLLSLVGVHLVASRHKNVSRSMKILHHLLPSWVLESLYHAVQLNYAPRWAYDSARWLNPRIGYLFCTGTALLPLLEVACFVCSTPWHCERSQGLCNGRTCLYRVFSKLDSLCITQLCAPHDCISDTGLSRHVPFHEKTYMYACI